MDEELKKELREIRYSIQAIGWVVAFIAGVLLLS